MIGFFLSRSRTSFILYLICLGCFFILNRKQNRGFCRLIVWSPTICAVFCLAAMYLMDVGNTLISRLDVALEHRLTFASQYIQKYPINLGGHYIYELTLSDHSIVIRYTHINRIKNTIPLFNIRLI